MHSSGPVRHREEVVVNVYDLSKGWNAWGGPAGLGLYHSGIQIYGTEYTFSNAGVMRHSPRDPGDANCTFRVGIVLGKLPGKTMRDVEHAVFTLQSGDFRPGTYSLLKRNCNHFAESLAKELLGTSLPGWVNRLSRVGVYFRCLLPKEALGDPDVHSKSTPSSSSSVRAHFSGPGLNLSGGKSSSVGRTGANTQTDADAAERRAKVAAAAEARRKALRAANKR